MKQTNEISLMAHKFVSHGMRPVNQYSHQKQIDQDQESSSSSDDNEEVRRFYVQFK
jgi:hypothetical protein